MRQGDITLGAIVWTNVGGRRVRAFVVSTGRVAAFGTRAHVYGGKAPRRMLKFQLRSVETGKVLPKLRGANALHVCGHNGWGGLGERDDAPCNACAQAFRESNEREPEDI